MINQLRNAKFTPDFLSHTKKDYKAMTVRNISKQEAKNYFVG